MTEQKILLLTCSTGEGHNSAARAVAAELSDRGIPCDVRDVLDFKSKKAGKRASKLYGYAVKRTPRLFGCVYSLGALYDRLRLPSPLYAVNARSASALNAFLGQGGYTGVICMHIFAMETMTAVRRTFGSSLPCYGVITDYTIHPFVKDTNLDGYFVSSENVAEQFFRLGFPKEKIFVTGIPVHPKFRTRLAKREARRTLSLPNEKKIVLVMTGGNGCGKVVRLCARLKKTIPDAMIAVLTGRNDALRKKLRTRFGESIRVQPFTPDVPLYLSAADCVISKSGGLSSTEIASIRVPLVHWKAVPGLESANSKYFSARGLSLISKSVRGAAAKTRLLLKESELSERMLAAQMRCIHPYGAKHIADIITEETYDSISLDPVHSGRIPVGQYSLVRNHSESPSA